MNNLIAINQILDNEQQITRLQRLAEIMATAQVTVPDGIRGNVGDCFMICVQAHVWNMSPFAVAQKTFTVKGKIGYEAQLVSAVITRHALKDKPKFVYSNGWEKVLNKFTTAKNNGKEYTVSSWKPQDEDGLYVDISATLKSEDQPRTMRIYLSQAYPRQSSIWATDPKQQLAYTAIKKFARLHCPECILGVMDQDDIEAVQEKDVTPKDKFDQFLQGESVTVRTEIGQPSAGSPGQPSAGSPGQPPGRSTDGQYIEDCQESTQEQVIVAASDDALPRNPEAMKQRVRETLRESGQVVDVGPTEEDKVNLDMAIQCLRSSRNTEQLEEAATAIKDVLHAAHREQAREVYREMVRVLS